MDSLISVIDDIHTAPKRVEPAHALFYCRVYKIDQCPLSKITQCIAQRQNPQGWHRMSYLSSILRNFRLGASFQICFLDGFRIVLHHLQDSSQTSMNLT